MRVTSRPFAIAETSFFVSRFAVAEVAWPLVALDDERVFSFHGIILPQSAVFAPKFLRQRYWRDKAADADCWGERGGRGERAAKTTKVMHNMHRWWYNDSMIGGNKVRIPLLACLCFIAGCRDNVGGKASEPPNITGLWEIDSASLRLLTDKLGLTRIQTDTIIFYFSMKMDLAHIVVRIRITGNPKEPRH